MSDLVSLNCPSCGGHLTLDRSSIGAECKYCGSQFLIKEAMTAQGLNNVADAVNNLADSQQSYKERYNNLLNRIKRGIMDSDWDNVMRWCGELYDMDSSDQVYQLKAKVIALKDLCCNLDAKEKNSVFEQKICRHEMTAGRKKTVLFAILFGVFLLITIILFCLDRSRSDILDIVLVFSILGGVIFLCLALGNLLRWRSNATYSRRLLAEQDKSNERDMAMSQFLSGLTELFK